MNKIITYTVIASFAGSTIPVAAKLGLEVFGPFTLVFFRFALSCAVLFVLVPKVERGLRTARGLWVISLLGAMNPILFFFALQFTEASIAPIIYSVIPIMAAVYSYFFFKERLRNSQVLGLVIGMIGISIITVLPLLEDAPDTSGFWANGLIIVASVSVMLYGVRSKSVPVALKVKPETIVYHFSLMSLLISAPLAVYEVLSDGIVIDAVEPKHIIAVIGVGVGSLIGYVAVQRVLKVASATVAFMTGYMQPVMTATLAVIVLDESITRSMIIAAVFSFYGAWLVQRKTSP